MGHCIQQKKSMHNHLKYQLEDFQLIKLLGIGGTGKVWKITQLKTQQIYALKIMDKAKILSKKKIVREVMNERLIMADLLSDPCPYIVNLKSAFQNTHKLFLVLDYIEGKDLSYYIKTNHTFTEHQISTTIIIKEFIVICLLKALNYLRKKNIIHQDIKPDNIIIDKYGFPRLIDFSVANYWNKINQYQNGGTPSYMAPELLFNQTHSYSVDYYALGVTIFELFFKKLPYSNRNKEQLKQQIYSKDSNIQDHPQLETISKEATDFILKLLQKKQTYRLGYQSITQIYNHPWINFYLSPLQFIKWEQKTSPILPIEDVNSKPRCNIKTQYLHSSEFYYCLLNNSFNHQHFEEFNFNGLIQSQKQSPEKKTPIDLEATIISI